ncbi:MAG: SpoIID/LytB domain-containing protein, partial [Actinobacteria bacterium]|nr:SpoIID/LytB domain-containing protein [Actinomycetota bacterium]
MLLPVSRRPGPSLAGLLLVLVLATGLLVALPERGAAASGCFPAGGADQPFVTSQAVKDAGKDISINGGGWGHGLGMSQYGAYGAGLLGCNHEEILETYFPGTQVTADAPSPPKIVVGLIQKGAYGELTAESGDVTWRLVKCVGDATCAGEPELPVQVKGHTWRITSLADGTFRITDRVGTQPETEVWKGGDLESLLRAPHEGTIVRVAIHEGGGISSRRVKYGFTEFDSYASEGGRIFATQHITPDPAAPTDPTVSAMERYLWGLAEVPTGWPYETLKAQAVAGRSYAQRRTASIRDSCRCHILATTSDQVYRGYSQEEADAAYSGGNWKKAVSASATRVLRYGSTIADTYYSSSHGGWSDESEHVWTADIPYVVPVDSSRWETTAGVNNPNQRWSVGFTYEELAAKYGWASFERIEVVERSFPQGRPTRQDPNGDGLPDGVRLTGYDANGNRVTKWLSGEQIRFSSTGLGLKSSLIQIEVLNGPDESPTPEPEEPTDAGRTGPTIEMACPQGDVPPSDYPDVAPNIHSPAIDCVSWWEVAQGREDGTFGPFATVRRDQMASFLVRALAAADFPLDPEPDDHFTDDDGTTHELAINQLAQAGIVEGTAGDETRYVPEGIVSRAQMAAFLVRAYE